MAAEEVEGEMKYGPSDSTMALMYQDATGCDVYVRMGTDRAHALLLPFPTAVPPAPLGSCERQHCMFHAAEGVHEHRLSSSRQPAATSPAGALERFEFRPLGRIAERWAWRMCPQWVTRPATSNSGT